MPCRGTSQDAKSYPEKQVKKAIDESSSRYHFVVYWSDEDQCYVGLCPDLFYGGTHGDNPEQVFKDLRAIVADVAEGYKAEDKPLPEPRDLVAA